ncbi:5'/3'-nucleotidase SurE [Pseudomaricurvus hydrocarbonicus]|nr:5'/3'-nucleotidase SurE [Aestuariicella hydrocarbonica]
MLTNDDGFQHPWIRMLQSELVKAGHQVTIVAPEVNQSGQSAALTLSAIRGGSEAIKNPSPDIYSVQGSPATATILGVKEVMTERPQLIISGINEGANIGVISAFSGTVGATIAALHLLGEPIPAIAISGNLIDKTGEPNSDANIQHARDISQFMVRLVAGLERATVDGTRILPPGIALNVNYPSITADQIKGVGVYQHGRDIGVNFTGKGALPVSVTESTNLQDTTFLQEGFITIVPIDGDYTAPNWNSILPESLLQDLNS